MTCTIGNDPETAAVIEVLGGKHETTLVNEVVVDQKYELVATPAYMLAGSIKEAHSGIKKWSVNLAKCCDEAAKS